MFNTASYFRRVVYVVVDVSDGYTLMFNVFLISMSSDDKYSVLNIKL